MTNHPVVDQVIRVIERASATYPFDSITVDERDFDATRKWVTIRAERHAGTLAATTVQVHVRTSGPTRAKFVGGHVFRTLTPDRKIRTWRDLRISAF